MSRTFHLALDVAGFLSWAKPKDFKGMFKQDGKPVPWHAAKRYLLDQLAIGHKIIPYGDICEGFSYETGCPGHEVQTNSCVGA